MVHTLPRYDGQEDPADNGMSQYGSGEIRGRETIHISFIAPFQLLLIDRVSVGEF